MCSELGSCHLWPVLNGTRVGTSFLPGKPMLGTQNQHWACAKLPNIAGIMAAAFQGTSCDLMSTRALIRQETIEKTYQMNSTFRNRLANPGAYSTTSSDPNLDARTVIGVGHGRGLQISTDRRRSSDADSEAESDTSKDFDSESEGIEGLEDDDDDKEYRFGDEKEFGGESGYAVDDDNDTTMTNMESPASPPFAQTNAYAAITNQIKKPRRCKLSRKHYSGHGPPGAQRSMTSPAVLTSGMDIDMDAPVEEDPDDYYSDSSVDEDTDSYAYSAWFGGIYHPMWLGHASASGKKRRDNGPGEDAGEGREGKAVEDRAVAELGKRDIKLPSLSRRKRAWKASQGTRSSVGESEWSLTVNHPMPPPSGNNGGVMPSPPMSPPPITTTKQMHTAPRSTQSSHRQNPARALGRRLENPRVEDLGRGTTVSTTIAVAANDSSPRMPSDQHKKKRTRYQQTSFEVASVDTTGGGVITNPVFWDVALEEPMGFRSSGVDGQLETPGFRMTGIEVNMNSPMGGMMPLGGSGRAKDISRVMEGVDDLI
ncbi:hypothetical protein EV426DRAFT_289790 [Tirmania nivea]|nr:hypothetical protein EV426DRAFT_289790 [Tirmania nivea]